MSLHKTIPIASTFVLIASFLIAPPSFASFEPQTAKHQICHGIQREFYGDLTIDSCLSGDFDLTPVRDETVDFKYLGYAPQGGIEKSIFCAGTIYADFSEDGDVHIAACN